MEIRPFSSKDRRFIELATPPALPSFQMTAKVAEMLHEIQQRGEAAWSEYLHISGAAFKVDSKEIDEARHMVSEQFLTALSLARVNIRKFHEFQRNRGYHHDDGDGVFMRRKYHPLARVGLLCGNSFSAMVMGTVPAQVAGIGEIAAAVETDAEGKIDPHLLATAKILGIEHVYRMSGVPAVAAFAFGLGGVAKVDKIVGPGGEMAAAAKHAVSGMVGVDDETRPLSQIFLVDASADAKLIAMDLLAQAEADDGAGNMLVFATDRLLGEAIRIEVDRLATSLHNQESLLAVLNERGCIFLFPDLDAAIDVCNRIAPSRVLLMTQDDDETLPFLDNAGTVYTGMWTPQACGEYLAGVNAFVPAAANARFAPGFGVEDFLAPVTVLHYSPERLVKSGRHAMLLAEAEGRQAGAAAIKERLNLLRIAGE